MGLFLNHKYPSRSRTDSRSSTLETPTAVIPNPKTLKSPSSQTRANTTPLAEDGLATAVSGSSGELGRTHERALDPRSAQFVSICVSICESMFQIETFTYIQLE